MIVPLRLPVLPVIYMKISVSMKIQRIFTIFVDIIKKILAGQGARSLRGVGQRPTVLMFNPQHSPQHSINFRPNARGFQAAAPASYAAQV